MPTPTQLARRLIEDNIAAILAPHFATLGWRVEVDQGELVLVELDGGGAKLYGESRDGVVQLSEFPDLGAQMAAADKLLDRVYGKPRQVAEISGPEGEAIALEGGWDLSKLSDRDLAALQRLAEKASGDEKAGP